MAIPQTEGLTPKIPAVPNSRITRIEGFGQALSADGYLFRPTTTAEVKEVLLLAKANGKKVVLRGSGRSYGDASIAAEAIILDITRMNHIISSNKLTGEYECQGGVTIEKLWRYAIEDGFWPPVVSGTMYPTLAGALGMNIHGKNNFVSGTFGENVTELDVVFPNGDVRTLTKESPLFNRVISSAGLLGVITRVKIKMKRIQSGDIRVLPLSAQNWDAQFEAFESLENDADYMVSWIDCFATGEQSGRGEFHAGWYLEEGQSHPSTLLPEHQDLPDTLLGFLPKSVIWRFLKPLNNRLGMRFINSLKHFAAKHKSHGKPYQQSLVGFSFLLDYVPNWRKAYLPGGFIQYQTFVPKEHAKRVFKRQLEMQQEAKLESFLGVVKRHKPDDFIFSHAVDGYSFALDFKVTAKNRKRLWQLCHDMNDLVLEAGGRFYLAKDSTLRPQDFEQSIGADKVSEFRKLKKELDPDNILTSALAKRLQIVEP